MVNRKLDFMVTINDIRNYKIREKYKEKLLMLDVTPDMLNLYINKYTINFFKIIKDVQNKEELNNVLKYKLLEEEGKDFYSYSILLGLHYGVYNLYCYTNLSENLIKKILAKRPDLSDTKLFFKNYRKDIVEFLLEKYNNIDEEKINEIINNMFIVQDNNSLYNNDISKEINKIMLGIELLYNKEEIRSYNFKARDSIIFGEAECEFDRINKTEKEIPSIIPTGKHK